MISQIDVECWLFNVLTPTERDYCHMHWCNVSTVRQRQVPQSAGQASRLQYLYRLTNSAVAEWFVHPVTLISRLFRCSKQNKCSRITLDALVNMDYLPGFLCWRVSNEYCVQSLGGFNEHRADFCWDPDTAYLLLDCLNQRPDVKTIKFYACIITLYVHIYSDAWSHALHHSLIIVMLISTSLRSEIDLVMPLEKEG